MPGSFEQKLHAHLSELYGERATECLDRIVEIMRRRVLPAVNRSREKWSERDVVLITYADQINDRNDKPLQVLSDFIAAYSLQELVSSVHLLPFFPFSSDDGFAVIDYRTVAPALGDWDAVHALGRHCALMFDLVLNHVSSRSAWFQSYLAGEPKYRHYFIEATPGAEWTQVVRPRSSPLFTPFQTEHGMRHVWTTFGPDQIDLNYAEPDVLLEMLDVLLFYVEHGARIIRLDAVAYLWKQRNTSCIHLRQTHTVIKLFRDILEAVAPHVLLLTETNVPHRENVSYFGCGDEAHVVYQFALPPLLLDAMLNGDGRALLDWLAGLDAATSGTTFLNFTASHDGVGVRPLEDLVSAPRLDRLIQSTQTRGGRVSTRADANGRESPYEINISYLDALNEPIGLSPALHATRFLTSQAVMLSLPGIPAVYFHSLVGTPNDYAGVKESGEARRINRHRYRLDTLTAALSAAGSVQKMIFDGYRRLLRARTRQPAFHPGARIDIYDTGQREVLCFVRTSLDGAQRILVAANLSGTIQALDRPLEDNEGAPFTHDLIRGTVTSAQDTVILASYEFVWLASASRT